MNLNKRTTSYKPGKEILYDVANLKTDNLTIDATKFTPGIVKAGTAVAINKTTGKAEPWADLTSTGEAMLTYRDEILGDKDIVTVGLVSGFVKASACTGVTDKFKTSAKLLYFK